MTDVRLKMSSPWMTYVNKLNALFKNDPQIQIEYDNDLVEVKLLVDNPQKADALASLLPLYIDFGGVRLHIIVYPANVDMTIEVLNVPVEELFRIVFEGNPIYAFQRTITGIFSNKLTYVVFKNRVVQFFNDNLNDIYGNISTLYQEIASDVFDMESIHGVVFCTDIEENVGKPLGEWP